MLGRRPSSPSEERDHSDGRTGFAGYQGPSSTRGGFPDCARHRRLCASALLCFADRAAFRWRQAWRRFKRASRSTRTAALLFFLVSGRMKAILISRPRRHFHSRSSHWIPCFHLKTLLFSDATVTFCCRRTCFLSRPVGRDRNTQNRGSMGEAGRSGKQRPANGG